MNARLAGIDPRLYFATDTQLCAQAGRGVAATAAAAVAGGAGLVQVRDKKASDAEFCALAKDVIEAVAATIADSGRRVPVVLNDRVAVAKRLLDAGADVHIHVGQADTPAQEVRQRLGPGPLIGLSVATPAEFAAARASGCVDLLGIGPAFATTTKDDAGAGLGVAKMQALAAEAGLPAVAIGGIDAQRAGQLRGTGVIGVCVVSAICLADDPQAMAARIHAAFA
jgi:thiamine-phosphate pyrophosphorylase